MKKSEGFKGECTEGDYSVFRNLHVGGNASIKGYAIFEKGVKVKGFFEAENLKGCNKGFFRTFEELEKEYPTPNIGWFAIVLDETDVTKGFLYISQKEKWELASETSNSFQFLMDSINVFFQKDEGEELKEKVSNIQKNLNDEITRAKEKELLLSTTIEDEAETREGQYNDLSERIATTESGVAKLNTTIVNYNAYKGTSNAFTLEQVLSDSGFLSRCDKGTILTFQSSEGWLKYQFSSSPSFENLQNPNNWKPFVERKELEELKEKVDLAAPIVIDWSAGYNMNIFTSIGEYIIKGTRTSLSDNLPVDSLSEIAARLFVVAAVSGNAITQVLVLNNVSGGDGNVYTRTAVEGENGYVWGAWAKLQSNVEVGQVNTLDNLLDNGIYSGVLTDGSSTAVGSFYDTFVLIVINNYAVSGPLGQQRSISQLKYSLSLDGGISISKRLGTGDESISWGEWSAIGGGGSAGIPMATYDMAGLVMLGTVPYSANLIQGDYAPVTVDSKNRLLVRIDSSCIYQSNYGLTLKQASIYGLGGVKLGTSSVYNGLSSGNGRPGLVVPLVYGSSAILGTNAFVTDSDKGLFGIPIYSGGGLELTPFGLKVSDSIGGGGSSNNNGVEDVTWDNSSNMNNYIESGVYNITGTRSNDRDNLPIANLGENATIAARLIVTVAPEGATTYRHSVGQTLILSNSEGKETKVYTRNGNRTIPTGGSSYEVTWGKWRCLQGLVESYINTNTAGITTTGGTTTGLNGMIENGMYSGIYTDDLTMQAPTFVETFVLVVINDYAVSSVAGTPRRISQLKYATDTITGQCTVKKRIGTGDSSISWSDWEEIDTRELVEKKDVQSSIDDSENPVQSKAIADALAEAVEKGRQLAKRDLFLAAGAGYYNGWGAEYNDTNNHIVKDTPWAVAVDSAEYKAQWDLDVIDVEESDIKTLTYKNKTYEYVSLIEYDREVLKVITRVGDKFIWDDTKVIHMAGHYYVNGLGNVNEKEMEHIYNGADTINFTTKNRLLQDNRKLRTFFPARTAFGGQYVNVSGQTWAYNTILEIVTFDDTLLTNDDTIHLATVSSAANFSNNKRLRVVSKFNGSGFNTGSIDKFADCPKLQICYLSNVRGNLILKTNPLISKSSIIYIINYAEPTTAITITVHPDAYARLSEDEEIITAITEKNEALSGTGGSIGLVSA